MKKTCLCILAVIFVTNVFASRVLAKTDTIKNPTVPKEIVATFSKTHPNAKLVNWAKSNGIYIVSYREETTNLWTTYNADGELLETKWKVRVSDLPTAIQDYIKKNNTQGIQEYYKIINEDRIVNYEVSSLNKSYVFNSEGELYKTIELLKK